MSRNGPKELDKMPKYKNMYLRAVEKHYQYRKERGKENKGIMETPEKYFEWWLKG